MGGQPADSFPLRDLSASQLEITRQRVTIFNLHNVHRITPLPGHVYTCSMMTQLPYTYRVPCPHAGLRNHHIITGVVSS